MASTKGTDHRGEHPGPGSQAGRPSCCIEMEGVKTETSFLLQNSRAFITRQHLNVGEVGLGIPRGGVFWLHW